MPTSGGLVCVACGRFLYPVHNSVTVEELTETSEPYKLWSADLWACRQCGTRVIAGFAAQPLVEHYQPEYAEMKARREPVYPGRPR